VYAQTGEVVYVVDYMNQSSYKVVALPKITQLEGFEVVTDPENLVASPNGWSTDTLTTGNNVDSHIDPRQIDGGRTKEFDTAWDVDLEPTEDVNQVAAIVNNFYTSTMVHDITYQYGFDEVSGNFQTDNFGKGGLGNDAVFIKNQAPGKMGFLIV
jgi:extracellular elastinolytic metalloproteinase